MRLGYDLTIEQQQKLVMTPELIQAIQILQFNTQELDSYIQEQLLTNPMLEQDNNPVSNDNAAEEMSMGIQEVSEIPAQREKEKELESSVMGSDELTSNEWAEHIREREYDDISYRQGDYSKDDNDYSFEQFATSELTLPEHLLSQLQLLDITPKQEMIGMYIIESLDQNGYMTLSVEDIAKVLNVSIEKTQHMLEIVQGFEPPGVAAKDLKECLLLQLDVLGELDDVVERVVSEFLEDIAANKLTHIAKVLNITVQRAQEISDLIRTLEPKPGRQFASQSATRYVVPDVIVEKINEEYVVSVNETSTPRLMVSSYYEKVLRESNNDPGLTKFLSGRLNSAVWLIKSIEQRKQTIFNVVSAVVKYQQDFFDKGPKYLKTLNLKQIAEEVGIHESTVSRSIHGKYMQSPRGVFEIKYFFSSGVESNQGEGIAAESIKTMIKEIVASEDSKAPYSDQAIAEMLEKKSVKISRRTVAKYRDELNILSSSKRKRF